MRKSVSDDDVWVSTTSDCRGVLQYAPTRHNRINQSRNLARFMLSVRVNRDHDVRAALKRRHHAGFQRRAIAAIDQMRDYPRSGLTRDDRGLIKRAVV